MTNDTGAAPKYEPLDLFDPTEDGWEPKSLGEVLEAGQAVLAAINEYRKALYGCRTPLNLKKTESDAEGLAHVAAFHLEALVKTRDLIETDAPLAKRFEGDDPWVERGDVLSPKQVIMLARRAEMLQPAACTTYRDALAETPGAVPTLIVQERAAPIQVASFDWLDDARDAREALNEQVILDVLADIEAIECTSCGAAAGAPCQTSSGRTAETSHMPRRKASELAKAHPKAAGRATRKEADGFAPATRFVQSPRASAVADNRKLVDEVVSDIATGFGNMDR